MPAFSKYVLQKTDNGQHINYESEKTLKKDNENGCTILYVADDQINSKENKLTNVESHLTKNNANNDEELSSLTWLNDQNLIKGIVTKTTENAIGNDNSDAYNYNAKRNADILNKSNKCDNTGKNLYFVNINNHQDLSTITAREVNVDVMSYKNPDNSFVENQFNRTNDDFQQQLKEVEEEEEDSTQFNAIANRNNYDLNSLVSLTLTQDNESPIFLKNNSVIKEQQNLNKNIISNSAKTTIHTGASGTTTVVEYKSNFIPKHQQAINNYLFSNYSAKSLTKSSSTNSENNTNIDAIVSSYSINNSKKSKPSTVFTSIPSLNGNKLVTSNSVNPNISYCNSDTFNNSNKIIEEKNQFNKSSFKGNITNKNVRVTTTHHPHKKYLRENMNNLKNSGNINFSIAPTTVAFPVVSSPDFPSKSNQATLSSTFNTAGKLILTSIYSKPEEGENALLCGTFENNLCCNTENKLHNNKTVVGLNEVVSNNYSSNLTSLLLNNNTSFASSNEMNDYAISSKQSTTNRIENVNQQTIKTPALTEPIPVFEDLNFLNSYVPQNQHSKQISQTSPISYSSYENDSLKDYESITVNRSTTNGTNFNINLSKHEMQHENTQYDIQTSKSSTTSGNAQQKQKHPNNVPYDPLVHTHNKPPYSFSSLIFMAIEGSNEKALPVKEIYSWIIQHFPYFKTAPTGWKNSVRHNLSLNKSFVKVEKAPNMGKGSLWRVEQQQRQNLIQTLTRCPFFPNSNGEKTTLKNISNNIYKTNSKSLSDIFKGKNFSNASPCFDPNLFPNLSKAFKNMTENHEIADSIHDEKMCAQNSNDCSINLTFSLHDCDAEIIDDVNAAAAMLALKHGPKVFSDKIHNGAPVITSSPSEDHTYSAGGGSFTESVVSTTVLKSIDVPFTTVDSRNNYNEKQNSYENQSNCASSDAAYESCEENLHATSQELEDQQRYRDGVDALLSLSLSSIIDSSNSCSPVKRPASTSVKDAHESECLEDEISETSIQPVHRIVSAYTKSTFIGT